LAREQLGFLRRGTPILLDALTAALRAHGVELRTAVTVEAITVADDRVSGLTFGGQHRRFDARLLTPPLRILVRLRPLPAAPQLGDMNGIEYITVVCLILKLRRPLTDGFWINVNDARVPFNGFIEYTNLNPRADAQHPHLLYVPFYLPPGHPRFAQRD